MVVVVVVVVVVVGVVVTATLVVKLQSSKVPQQQINLTLLSLTTKSQEPEFPSVAWKHSVPNLSCGAPPSLLIVPKAEQLTPTKEATFCMVTISVTLDLAVALQETAPHA